MTSRLSRGSDRLNSIRKSKIGKRLVALIAAATFASFIWFMGTDCNVLTSKAVEIASTRDWSIDYVPYQWLSNSEVLYSVKRNLSNDQFDKLNLSKLNIDTRAVNKLDAITSALRRLQVTSCKINHETGEILWSHPSEFIVTTGTGSLESHFKSPSTGWYSWLGSSRTVGHFLSYDEGMEILSITGKKPILTRHIRFPKVSHSNTPSGQVVQSSPSGHIIMASWRPNPSLFIHEGSLEMSSGIDVDVGFRVRPSPTVLRLGDRSEATIEEYSADTKSVLIGHATILLPHHTSIQDIVISPDGRRVLWQLRISQPSLLAELGRWIPTFRPHRNTYSAFWLSNIDGSELHQIAYQPEDNSLPPSVQIVDMGEGRTFIPGREDQQRCEPSNVRWLPSSDKISFLYRDHLWLLPL